MINNDIIMLIIYKWCFLYTYSKNKGQYKIKTKNSQDKRRYLCILIVLIIKFPLIHCKIKK